MSIELLHPDKVDPWDIEPTDRRQLADEILQSLVELISTHPEATVEDIRKFAPTMARLRELSK